MMMRSNINEFIGRMDKRSRLLELAKQKTPQEAHSKFIVLAKNRVPIDTGETINNIRGFKLSPNKYRVMSTVSGSFKQNLWTNRTRPFRRPRMRWNNGEETLYGDGSHRTTGQPQWWDKSILDISTEYGLIASRHVNNALDVR